MVLGLKVSDPSLFVRIRILQLSSKNYKKNLYFYCLVTSLWLLIFEDWRKCTFKKYGKKQKNLQKNLKEKIPMFRITTNKSSFHVRNELLRCLVRCRWEWTERLTRKRWGWTRRCAPRGRGWTSRSRGWRSLPLRNNTSSTTCFTDEILWFRTKRRPVSSSAPNFSI